MCQSSTPALAGLASGQVCLQQNILPDFWIWPSLADFSTAAVHVDYLQLKVVKLVFACHHLSDLMV